VATKDMHYHWDCMTNRQLYRFKTRTSDDVKPVEFVGLTHAEISGAKSRIRNSRKESPVIKEHTALDHARSRRNRREMKGMTKDDMEAINEDDSNPFNFVGKS
jgi:hypothetical protein